MLVRELAGAAIEPAASAWRIARCSAWLRSYSWSRSSSDGAQSAGPENVRRAAFATDSMYGASATGRARRGRRGSRASSRSSARAGRRPGRASASPSSAGRSGARTPRARQPLVGQRRAAISVTSPSSSARTRNASCRSPCDDRAHADAAVRLERDEAERGEPPQRLAHGRARDTEPLRELLLPEH